MTLREKIAQLTPIAIDESCIGGVKGCPVDYFKELNGDVSYRLGDSLCPEHNNGTLYSCRECWSREYDEKILQPIHLEEIDNSPVENDSPEYDEEYIDRVNESLSGNMKRTLFEMRELNDKLAKILFLLTGEPQEKLEEKHEFTNFIGISLKQKQNVEHSLDVADKILIALKGTSTNED